ncbi:MAG: transporter substrate-binding domain-containing protein, partial [Alphaproteobacteria bacterium]|nr:transporter substrate-binding domain-containing protein [Alphaproteobacteria bacterium]
MTRLLACLLFLLSSLSFAGAATLDEVKSRGKLLCGVNPGLQGFAAQTAEGQWTGFDVDFCKAVAAATLGNASLVEFVPLDAAERFDKLKSGAVDV